MNHTELHAERLAALRRTMADYEVRNLLISGPQNRRYFSGFEAGEFQMDESSGALLITPDQQWLLTDARYTEAARREAPGFEILTYANGLPAEAAALKLPGDLYFEPEFITVGALARLRKARLKTLPLPFELGVFRAVKSPAEITLIKKALAITETAVAALWQKAAPGLTEAEAALFLDTEFRRLGADGPSFETIVASGPNGALPHATPGGRKFRTGDSIIIDCGARYKGYAADITRTKILGEPKPWLREIYQIVREAQLLALAVIRPGLTGAEADQAARRHITEKGFGAYFGHSLGHGVGLAIHEAPSLSPRNKKPLQAGEVVTVEPGIYLPGRGGVRLEQLVLVTETGGRVLNRNQDFYSF